LIDCQGNIYEGEFKNSEFSGHGKLGSFAQGGSREVQEGVFEAGEFVQSQGRGISGTNGVGEGNVDKMVGGGNFGLDSH
jgi:hypothetical protein